MYLDTHKYRVRRICRHCQVSMEGGAKSPQVGNPRSNPSASPVPLDDLGTQKRSHPNSSLHSPRPQAGREKWWGGGVQEGEGGGR